ncbi:MAG: hypothetical protein ACLSAF_19865 [Intestinimonas sp.]
MKPLGDGGLPHAALFPLVGPPTIAVMFHDLPARPRPSSSEAVQEVLLRPQLDRDESHLDHGDAEEPNLGAGHVVSPPRVLPRLTLQWRGGPPPM